MRWRRSRNGGAGVGERTIFFATDLHASEICFRKFVAAAGFYKADVLILGGDLTGKTVVPIVALGDGRCRAELGEEERVLEADSVKPFEQRAADRGAYTVRMTPDEHAAYVAHPERVDALIERLMLGRLERWVDYARERLADTEVLILTAPGNDDPYAVDDVIRERGSERVLLLEGQVFEIAPGHQMISTGVSNPTPWNTPRELSEAEIRELIESMASSLEEPAAALFNVHVPPYDSGIDAAPALDEDLTVKTAGGATLTAPAGSTAVRAAIEEYQPLVSLHGHIHEAGGAVRIGRTLALNAGSEYADGVLRGVLLTVGDGRVLRYQATTG